MRHPRAETGSLGRYVTIKDERQVDFLLRLCNCIRAGVHPPRCKRRRRAGTGSPCDRVGVTRTAAASAVATVRVVLYQPSAGGGPQGLLRVGGGPLVTVLMVVP